jgi:hypothetical protein
MRHPAEEGRRYRLPTVELNRSGDGTRLVLTEQGAFLDGLEPPAWREQGTGDWLDALGVHLGTTK